MEAHERQLLVDQLTSSRDRLLELVDGLTAEQWAFRQSEGRWSIGECMEHVTRVQNRILGLIAKRLEEGPAEPEKRDPTNARDAFLAKAVLDRTNRFQAPEPVRPTGQWADSSQLLAEFRKAHQRTTEFAIATQSDLRSYFHPHAVFGELDCYQWLFVLSLHGVRHAQQIEEIKAAPDFPAGELIPS